MTRKAIIFIGPPGSGKGTQSHALSRVIGADILGTGDLLREEIEKKSVVGLEIETLLSRGEFPDFSLVISVLRNALEHKNSHYVILDGVPRNIMQIPLLEDLLQSFSIFISDVFFFDVPFPVIRDRLSIRYQCALCKNFFANPEKNKNIACPFCESCELKRRDDDQQEVVEKRLSIYQETFHSVIDHYDQRGLLRYIDASGDTDLITQDLVKSLGLYENNAFHKNI